MADQDGPMGVLTSPKPTGDGTGVKVEEAGQRAEYERSLQIVLGTVCGVFGLLGLLLILSFLYRFYNRRHSRNITGGRENQSELHSSVSIDLESKQLPSVLLLYSYDCASHEKVVSALAGYLIETCNCNVHLDLFEDQVILERGLDDWLVEKLQDVDFIIVLCSVGARLRCSKKRIKFKTDPCRVLPDYFAIAVDYVAEKMRVERTKGLGLSKFIVLYMEYSTQTDIPHQLEAGAKFCLMKDINSFVCHLHGLGSEPSKIGCPFTGISDKTYDKSELGIELHVAIDSAKEYFKANPNWVEDRMELPPPSSSGKSKLRHGRKSSLVPLLDPSNLVDGDNTGQYVDTSADIHSQTVPRSVKETVYVNRKNSLPSSLESSHMTVSTPPLNANGSKSYEHFQSRSKSSDLDTWSCIFCGQETINGGQSLCRCRKTKLHKSQVADVEEDSEHQALKNKSKSMPTVHSFSHYSSQTVLHAEVHKEWSDLDGKVTPTDSQETSSNPDLMFDDLASDLRSIVMPSSYNNIPCLSPTNNIPKYSKFQPMSFSAGDNVVMLQPYVEQPLLFPLQKMTHHGDSASTLGSTGDPVICISDVVL